MLIQQQHIDNIVDIVYCRDFTRNKMLQIVFLDSDLTIFSMYIIINAYSITAVRRLLP